MPTPTSQVCLVTAATEGFVPGAVVALGSFLKHHPDFDGDVIVVHEALPEPHRRRLADACPRLRFEPVSPDLRHRLDALGAACPAFAARRGQFHSLEAFRLKGYRKVLWYDSDVLFQAPVDELFDSPAALLCCGDDVFLRGWSRDARTYAPQPKPDAAGGTLERTFGAGFLLIDGTLVDEGCYRTLLDSVAPETWRGTATTHADQIVLNRRLAGRQTLVGWTYDFVLPQAEAIRMREGIDAASAKVLHFAGPVKPWMPDALLRWTSGDPRFKPVQAYKAWWNAYVDHLAAAHVRSVRARLRERRGRAPPAGP